MSEQPEDRDREAYLWDPKAPAAPDVERVERTLGSLRSRAPLEVDSLPTRLADRRSAPSRPAGLWGAAGALAAAAAVLVFSLLRAPEPPPISRADDSGRPRARSPGGLPSAGDPGPSVCETTSDGSALEIVEGVARCGGRELRGKGFLPVGVWVETPVGARVALAIGEVGRVEVGAGSKIRVLSAEPNEHRLELARGALHAKIDAPARVFSIETPHATVVDLGCEYDLEIGEGGAGELRVKKGFVALEAHRPEVWAPGPARSTLVPKGAQASILPGRGPGLPVWSREPAEVKDAVLRFDRSTNEEGAFEPLFAGLGERDTLTLVHLLDRVQPKDRGRVLARLEAVEKPPAETRARILEGDTEAIGRYREALVDRWFPKQ